MAESKFEIDDRRLGAVQAFYRDEMRRSVAWRARLDRTSNWAVVLTATLLTWTFSKPENPHFVILVALPAIVFFLALEAARYRHYDAWRSRLRLIECEILAPFFVGETECTSTSWQRLSSDLAEPSFKIPYIEALQRRLRRVYAPILLILLMAWVLKVAAFSDGESFVVRAGLGWLPGWSIVTVVVTFSVLLLLTLGWPLRRRAMGHFTTEDVTNEAWQEGGQEAESDGESKEDADNR